MRRTHFVLVCTTIFFLSTSSLHAQPGPGEIKGFKSSWVRPDVDFKAYNAIFIREVGIKDIKLGTSGVLDNEADKKEIENLATQMQKRFSDILNTVIHMEKDEKSLRNEKALMVHLRLTEVAGTDVGTNVATGLVIGLGATNAALSMQCEIFDSITGELVISLKDKHESTGFEPNASWLGSEDLDKWQHAYNTMDLWADRLAKFLAKKRGQKYKSQLKSKLL